MDPRFKVIVDALEQKLNELLAMEPVTRESLPRNVPGKGIYLFSDEYRHLYVGRSDNIRKRIALHCRPSSGHNQATFAFRMARDRTGKTEAAYAAVGGRKSLVQDEKFGPVFSACKHEIRRYRLRFVEEDQPTRQALLEIYVATVLQTLYNDFENH